MLIGHKCLTFSSVQACKGDQRLPLTVIQLSDGHSLAIKMHVDDLRAELQLFDTI
jgi:hypothetical protein